MYSVRTNFRDKKILVTGADGFIGSHLVETLIAEGCQVKAFVYYNSFNSWGWLDTFSKEQLNYIEIFTGDIRDPIGVRTAIKGVDVVFHLAALIGIPFSYNSPDSYIDTNIKGTLNVLQACRDYPVERVVVTSTSEVYGTAHYVPIDEKHPLQGQSPYSASKIGADKMAESYYFSFGLPVTIIRPFNTYGPRQSARAVIPTIITQLLRGGHLKLGSLHPTRDLNYVSDIVDAFLKVAVSEKSVGEVINIGSGLEISIGDLARKIMQLTGRVVDIISEDQRIRPEKSEVERLIADNSKARNLLGWEPKVSLEEGLKKTIEWIGNNQGYYKSNIYNV
jgi:NAD dependent epimerase/dehydratase